MVGLFIGRCVVRLVGCWVGEGQVGRQVGW